MSNPIVEALKAARQSIRIHRRTLASKDWGVSMPLDDAEASLRTVAAGVESLVAENARLRAAMERWAACRTTVLQAEIEGWDAPHVVAAQREEIEAGNDIVRLVEARALKGDD